MKKILTIVAILIATSAFTQTTQIFVAVAKIKSNNKCAFRTDLPDYKIVSGTTPGTKLGREAKEALQKKYEEQYKNADLYIEVASNSSALYGNLLTIISTNTDDKNGCKRFIYGIGFGKDKEGSLKNAEKHLESIIWNGGKKFTYKIVKQELIEAEDDLTTNEEASTDKTATDGEGMGKLKRKS